MTREPDHLPGESQPDEMADVLAHATFVTMGILTKIAADNDLSLTQLRLLAILRDRRVTMTALATHLGLDKSTMTGLVDRAQQRGLLARARNNSDGRSIDVALTSSGFDLAASIQGQVAKSLSTLTDKLSAVDRQRLQVLLMRMLA